MPPPTTTTTTLTPPRGIFRFRGYPLATLRQVRAWLDFRRKPPALRRALQVAAWAYAWQPPPGMAFAIVIPTPTATASRVSIHLFGCCGKFVVPIGDVFVTQAQVLAEIDRSAYQLAATIERIHVEQQVRDLVVMRDEGSPLDLGVPIAITLPPPSGARPVDCGGDGKGGDETP